jgi:hypothetical protein
MFRVCRAAFMAKDWQRKVTANAVAFSNRQPATGVLTWPLRLCGCSYELFC